MAWLKKVEREWVVKKKKEANKSKEEKINTEQDREVRFNTVKSSPPSVFLLKLKERDRDHET